MGKASKPNALPDKVFALHVFFTFISIATLLVGMTWLGEQLRVDAFRNDVRMRFNKAQTKLAISSLCHGDKSLQALTEQVCQEYNFSYCAIVDRHGVFVTHNQKERIGTLHREPTGSRSEKQ